MRISLSGNQRCPSKAKSNETQNIHNCFSGKFLCVSSPHSHPPIYYCFREASSAAESEMTYEQLMSRIGLFPIPKDFRQDCESECFYVIETEKSEETAIPQNKRKSMNIGRWKHYDDDFLSFDYPDDPSLQLEIKDPKDAAPLPKELASTYHNYSFSKAYRLLKGKETIGLLMIHKTDQFDEDTCFCSPIVFDKYVFFNGAFFRFSYMPDGLIKKIQALGNGVRAVMFEWTHSQLSQKAYIKMALSIHLKATVADQGALKQKIYKIYGGQGFLELGMNRQEIVALFGKPTQETPTALKYIQREDRWQTTMAIPLRNGQFQGFGSDWYTTEKIPAERGTVDWILETIRHEGADEANLRNFPKPMSITFSSEFWRLARKPTALTGIALLAIYELHKKGFDDRRVLPLVRRRFLEPKTNLDYAAWVLHIYDEQSSRELFAQRIRLILDETKELKPKESKEVYEPLWEPGFQVHNLFCFLGRSHPEFQSLLLEAFAHPCEKIREEAYFFWDELPAEKAKDCLSEGLEDKDTKIRQSASEIFAEYFGSKDDIPALKKRILAELDKDTLNNLKKAVERLEKKK